MSNNDMLQKIGLSRYQAQVYSCLLHEGPLDARKLSLKSDVPMGKIYSTLTQLIDSNIITEHPERPRRFEAVAPEIAFQRIYMRRYFEHEKQREEMQNCITRLVQNLDRKKTPFSTLPSLQIVYDNEDILNYFIRVHSEVKKEVKYVSHVRYGLFNSELDERTMHSLINNIGSVIKRGVSVKVIFPDSPYVRFFSQIVSDNQDSEILQRQNVEIDIRVLNTEHNFILIDDSTCIFELEDQRDLVKPYVMVKLHDAQLNSQLQNVFQKLWEDASVPDGPYV